jgi:EpsD family peptidyl-prolyl cis-trans isomerase
MKTRSVALACLAAAALLAGCGKREGAAESQVAARVNDDEITVHQVQAVLQRQPRLAQEFPEQAAAKALDILVEQQIAVQAARAEGIDKDPAVVQAVEAARREVIARAYQDRVADKATGPSSDEIDRYYEGNPGLFAKRNVYTLQEFHVATPDAAQAERLQAAMAAAKGAADFESRLGAAGMRYRSRVFVQAPEDMPMAIVAKVAATEVGQSITLPQPGSMRVVYVLHAQPAPVDRRLATPAIESFLMSERKRRLVADNMKPVREAARIEYVGNFARAASAPASAAAR